MVAKVSCFMITRNVLSQGYPFLEAIAQALPVCDEFLISDGNSTDGTYEALLRAAEENKKIKIFREEWPEASFSETLREATNRLRRRCEGSYLLYVQANEVIHEESWDYLKELPETWPRAVGFSLPFILLYRDFLFHEQYRLRYVKNLDYIEAIYDAWALGPSRSFLVKEAIKSLVRPSKLLAALYYGMRSMYGDPGGIPKTVVSTIFMRPVFRYQMVGLVDPYMKRMERARRWGSEKEVEEAMKAVQRAEMMCRESPDELLMEILESSIHGMERRGHLVPRYSERLRRVPAELHPKIMRELIERKPCRYHVREEVYEYIRGL